MLNLALSSFLVLFYWHINAWWWIGNARTDEEAQIYLHSKISIFVHSQRNITSCESTYVVFSIYYGLENIVSALLH